MLNKRWLKGIILGVLVLGLTIGAISQVSAFPSMSADPTDEATCLVCHPNGVHGEDHEDETPAPTTPTNPNGPITSAPYPAPTSSDVVWTLILSSYVGWDNAWDTVSKIEKPSFGNAWDSAWGNLK